MCNPPLLVPRNMRFPVRPSLLPEYVNLQARKRLGRRAAPGQADGSAFAPLAGLESRAPRNRRERARKDAGETVMQKLNSERGMSLVEATIILMVLAILTSVLAPSLGDYVNEARHVKVKEDLETLGQGIYRLLRDTGLPFPLRVAGSSPSRSTTNRVDLLVSEGSIPSKTRGTSCTTTSNGTMRSAKKWSWRAITS
jgi:type II secretory pathway pseudopilin PulG